MISRFHKAIASWMSNANVSYIWETQNPSPARPRYPYVSLYIIHDEKQQYPELDSQFDPGADLGKEIQVQRRWEHRICLRVSVRSTAKPGEQDAGEITETLIKALQRFAVKDAMDAYEVVAQDRRNSISVPETDGTSMIDRVATDFYFGTMSYDTEEIGYFSQVNVGGTVNGIAEPPDTISLD